MAESLGENCVGIAGRNKSVAGRNKLSQNRICVELKFHRLLRAVMGPIAGRNGPYCGPQWGSEKCSFVYNCVNVNRI